MGGPTFAGLGAFAELVAEALRDGGSLAVSGGSTPAPYLRALAARTDVPWDAVDLYQVDERLVAADDPERNWSQAVAALADPAGIPPARRHPLPVDGTAQLSLPTFDVVHLGLGDDGHTASWAPGWAVPDDVDVVVTPPYRGHRRITVTPRVVDRARRIVWLVAGEAKREALEQLLAGAPIPAAQVRRQPGVWVCTDVLPGSRVAPGA